MKTLKLFGLSIAAASSLMISSVNAGSVGGFGGSLEITQEAQWAADIGDRAAAYTQQLQQYATQLQQYYQQVQEWERKVMGLRMMVSNIGTLPENMKDQFINMARQMKDQMEQGQAIAYTAANIDDQFNKIFKGYDYFLEQSNASTQSFQAAYKTMYQSTRDTALNALKTLGIQEQDLQNDQVFMAKLRTAMNSAEGTEAAIAVANQLTYHQTEALQKLQKTIMTQANLQSSFLAKEQEEKALKQVAAANMHSDPIDETGQDMPSF